MSKVMNPYRIERRVRQSAQVHILKAWVGQAGASTKGWK